MKRKLSTYLGLALVLAVGGIATFAALLSISTPGSAQAMTGDNPAGITGEPRLSNTLVDLAPVATAVSGALTITQTPEDPGTLASYTAQFATPRLLANSIDKIIFTLDEEFSVPATIDRSNISISASAVTDGAANEAVTPLEVSVTRVGTASDLPQITLTIPDMATGSEGAQAGGDDITLGAVVTVIFRQAAGIKNPTEAGGDPWKVRLSGVGGTTSPASEDVTFSMVTPVLVELGSDDGKRGDKVTVVAKGVEGSTTSTFWRDGNANGKRDAGEIDLCSGLTGSDDIATCTYTVNNPPFAPAFGTDCDPGAAGTGDDAANIGVDGPDLDTDTNEAIGVTNCNFVNVIDGENRTGTLRNLVDLNNSRWELEDLVSISPNTGDPGDTVTVQLKDYAAGAITTVRLGGVFICGSTAPACTQVVPASGELNFTIAIPNGVPSGKQTLFVTQAGASSDADIIVGGATITPTPKTIVPNQRVSLIGSGFSEGAFTINEAGPAAAPCTIVSSITIGGEAIRRALINDGATINIDAGGSWSASIDMPITSATTTEGTRELKVTDCAGREGKFEIVFSPRVMTATPAEGRVGTGVRIKGTGFPAKNNDGSSITVTVTYDAGAGGTDQTTEQPDSGGNFEVDLEVPSDAAIPSTNTLKSEFPLHDPVTGIATGTTTINTVTHRVPEAKATLDKDRGQPGTIVTLKGEGFKRFTSVQELLVGTTDVTPAPKPSTDASGNVTVQFLIPGADSGVQTVKIKVGGVTASSGFTIETTPAVPGPGAPPAGPMPIGDALTTPLGADFVRAFNFDNQSKAWTFNDPRPDFAAINTLKEVVGGKVYWINVANDKTITFCGRSTALFKGWNQAAC